MTSPRRRSAAVGLAALVLVGNLSGCTDDGGGDGGGDGTERSHPTGDPDYAGPLAEFFGWEEAGPEGEAAFTEIERQNHLAVEELLVGCMREQGFEYRPMPFWGDRETASADPNQAAWDLQREDPEAFAEQYGYGITTIEYDYTEAEPDPATTDPNFAYREGLPEAERAAYDTALYEDCYPRANQQVYGDGDGDDAGIEQFDGFLAEMSALYERVREDSRVVEAKREWSECMAGAGYPGLADLYDPQERVTEQMTGPSGGDDPELLAEAREFELAIAWADYGCQQETRVEQIEREVQFALEEQFLADHTQQAEAYRDWLDGRRNG